MKVSELANLSLTINQAKTLLNTSSLSRFSKDDVTALKKKVLAMEDAFVKGVIGLTGFNDPVIVKQPFTVAQLDGQRFAQKVNEAVTLATGVVAITPPPDEVVPIAEAPKAETVTDETGLVTVAPPVEETIKPVEKPKTEDSELKARLAEEKKKLSAKKKAEKAAVKRDE